MERGIGRIEAMPLDFNANTNTLAYVGKLQLQLVAKEAEVGDLRRANEALAAEVKRLSELVPADTAASESE